MKQKPEPLQFCDDRPTGSNDAVYDWAVDAEEVIRSLHAENEALRKDAERWRMTVLLHGEAPIHPTVRKHKEAFAAYMDAVHRMEPFEVAVDLAIAAMKGHS